MDGLAKFTALMKELGGPALFGLSLTFGVFFAFLWFAPMTNESWERVGVGAGIGVVGLAWAVSTGFALGAAITSIGSSSKTLTRWTMRGLRIQSQSTRAKDFLCDRLITMNEVWSLPRTGEPFEVRELIAAGIVEEGNAYAAVIEHRYWNMLTGKFGWWLLFSGKHRPSWERDALEKTRDEYLERS